MKGCLALLLFMIALGLAEYGLLYGTPMAGSFGLPILSAILTGLALTNLFGLFMVLRKRRALSRKPSEWHEGEFVGLSGRLQSVRDPLQALGAQVACALYEYRLGCTRTRSYRDNNSTRTETSDSIAYTGMAMTACQVHAEGRRFRLTGFPLLHGVGESRHSDAAALRRMAAHLLGRPIKPKAASLRASLGELNAILGDEDGVVEHDQTEGNAFDLSEFQDLYRTDPERAVNQLSEFLISEQYWIAEKLVPDGVEVTVHGRFHGADSSIDVGSGMQHLEHGLALGTASQVSGRELRASLIALTIFLALAVLVDGWFGRALLPTFHPERYQGRRLSLDQAIGARINAKSAHSLLVQLAQDNAADPIRLLGNLGVRLGPGRNHDIEPLEQAREAPTVAALLDIGADPEIGDSQGTSPLMHAAERGDLESVQLLLAHKAGPNRINQWGTSALHYAASQNRAEIVRALIAAGADPNLRSKNGTTPLDAARSDSHAEVAALLLQLGAQETEVTATSGTAIAGNAVQLRLIDAYLKALHARDLAQVGLLHKGYENYDWKDTDWDAYLGGRPTRSSQAEGFANRDRATVRINGPTVEGYELGLVLGFELSHNIEAAHSGPLAAYEGWRIERDWIVWPEQQLR